MEFVVRLVPSIIIPKRIIELLLAYRAKNGGSEFEKTIRRLSYYATSYGANSTLMPLYGSLKRFFSNDKRRKSFIRKCHEGFSIVQDEIVRLLPEIEAKIPRLNKLFQEEVRKYNKTRTPPIPPCTPVGREYSECLFKSMVLKEIANSIAWQMLGNDGTRVRALMQGVSHGPAQKKQLQDILFEANKFNSQDYEGFALVSDITSCIEVGDLVIRAPSGEVGLYEAKSGTVNAQIQSILGMPPTDIKTQEKIGELVSQYGDPFLKQFERVLRQEKRMQQALEYIRDSVGTDIRHNIPRVTNVKPSIVDTYHAEINSLLRAAKKKGEDYLIIDDCLMLGAFYIGKNKKSPRVCKMDFQHVAWHAFFESWAECPYGNKTEDAKIGKHFEYMSLPVWEMRDKPFCSTNLPIFISGLEKEFIFDILFERIALFFYFAPQKFVSLCNNKGIHAAWITGRAYNKAKDEGLKAGFDVLDIHDGMIIIKTDDETTLNVGFGTLYKIIYEFHRPSSMVELYKDDLPKLLKKAT